MRGLKALFITKIYRIARMDENKKRLIINGNKCTKDSMAIKKTFLRFVKVKFWLKLSFFGQNVVEYILHFM